MTRTALIIGGGIAGPVTAMALQKAGIDAVVYEAHPARADGAGGGFSLAPNGLAALDVLGLSELVRPAGRDITAYVLQDWKGRSLAEFGNPPGVAPMQFFYRSDLYRALHGEAARRGIRIEFGKRLAGVREKPGAVTALFGDGTEATADMLVGADGIRSLVRELIDPRAPAPQYAGLISFGATVTDPAAASTRGRMRMILGKHAFFGYQVFDDGTAGWFANLPADRPLSATEARQTPAGEWLSRLAAAFAEDQTPAARLIGRTNPDDLLVVGAMESMPSVPAWHRGRMVLVGDSAHAPSSSSGQGASLALESAVELARCLRDYPAPEDAFAAYEAMRRPRVERIAKEAARKNNAKTAGPVGRVLMGVAIRLFARLSNPDKAAWMLHYKIDWNAPAWAATTGPAIAGPASAPQPVALLAAAPCLRRVRAVSGRAPMVGHMSNSAIAASGLRKAYGDKIVLDGIDLDVRAGTVFSLLGPNGAGKTTTVNVLTTLLKADGGTALVAGHDIATQTKAVRAAIGVTGQFAAVDELLTGQENLQLIADLKRIRARESRRVIADLLERFDLTESAGKLVSAYSGGMRRKLDLAMTLIGNPRIIFLDEPTTGLDPRSRRAMWDIVRGLLAGGVTVFLTTQYLEEADQLASRIAVLDQGRIVAQGTPDELKRQVPGSHIRLRFASVAELDAAALVLAEATRDDENLALRVPGDGSVRSLQALLARLTEHSINAAELSVHTPDLDDVFLALTGHANTGLSNAGLSNRGVNAQ